MKMVREAAVSAIDTTAKIANCIARLSIPMNPASAAASAPTPNQNSTKPDVKISATMSIAPRMHQRTQNHSLIVDSALRQILHYEPHIRRTFRQPAHEVRIPVFTIRNIDSYIETIACELSLKITPDAVKHLKLKLLFPDSLTLREIDRRVNHLRIVRRDAVVSAAC